MGFGSLGISTFGETPSLVGPDHLDELFKHALDHIPKHAVQDTPIFLLATAGVRLLPPVQRKNLLAEVCRYTRLTTEFLLPDCDLHIQAIPGETEGLYGWIAANYLLGGFDPFEDTDHGKGHHTYGFLDMGGASAQIAFAPNATETEKHASDLKLLRLRTLDGRSMEYRIFVTTWLGFGVNEARRRYVEALLESTGGDSKEIRDPCLPVGLTTTQKGEVIHADSRGTIGTGGGEPYLLGTGRFDECLRRTYPLLDKDAPCKDKPCLLHGVHVPAIDFDVNHFVGVSEFWHTTHGVFELGHEGKGGGEKYDFETYQNNVKDFCSQDWNTISELVRKKKFGKKVDEETALGVCFKASWLINVLHDGIGIPRIGMGGGLKGSGHTHNVTRMMVKRAKSLGFADAFQPFNRIANVEVSWTLGKIVLYAASQIPAHDGALPVGFGSNVEGIPPDFQYAAGSRLGLSSNSSSGGVVVVGGGGSSSAHGDFPGFEEDAEWRGGRFGLNTPRRIPGFFLFVFIFCLAVYLLLGRERRARLFRRFGGRFGRSGGFRSKGPRHLFGLGGGSGVGFERLLESGDGSTEFELTHADEENDHSDSSDGSHDAGLSSGWATPRLKASFAQGSSGYFDNVVSQGQGLGLGPPGITVFNAMDRSGLVIRTESRERLAPLASPKMSPFLGGSSSSGGGGGGVGNGGGRRSRTASPIRGKSPLISPLAIMRPG
ncbi:MAG: Golgi apyrase [Trichoglossum hirsutum]|jgi:Golgi apyrase|nr:MAG: Golgi apyrase [Trichoglossum hirsutum]